jgi:hypothetical protein
MPLFSEKIVNYQPSTTIKSFQISATQAKGVRIITPARNTLQADHFKSQTTVKIRHGY